MEFSTISHTIPFEPRKDSKNQVEMTESVKEIDESSILSVEESQVQLQAEDALKLEEGDIFFTPSTEEYPFGQARKVTAKTAEGDIAYVNTTKPELTEMISDLDISQSIPINGDNFILNPDLLGDSSNIFRIQSSTKPIDKISLDNNGFKIVFNDYKIEKLNTTYQDPYSLEIQK